MIGHLPIKSTFIPKPRRKVFHRELDAVSPIGTLRAKTVNFGIVYGISDYGLSRDLKIPRAEAKGISIIIWTPIPRSGRI